MRARRLGFSVLYDPEAVAIEFPASTVSGEFTRRVRLRFDFGSGARAVANNGAAGMPNFGGTRYGVVTRVGRKPFALLLPDVPEVLSPLPAVVPLQLFSYFLAVGRGSNPDLLRRDDERYRAARGQYE